MSLNVSKGNMYEFVTHTFNTVKGECKHDCSYCYMKKWKQLKSQRFDSNELKTDLGKGNFIFVGSSNDLFANEVSSEWIKSTLQYCCNFDNRYLFQSKNPANFINYLNELPENSILCTTIESNRFYHDIMCNAPSPLNRAEAMSKISNFDKFVTIEPILDFDLEELVELIRISNPFQVNIGGVSGGHKLPEPPKDKIITLINELSLFTKVVQKKNLQRLLK